MANQRPTTKRKREAKNSGEYKLAKAPKEGTLYEFLVRALEILDEDAAAVISIFHGARGYVGKYPDRWLGLFESTEDALAEDLAGLIGRDHPDFARELEIRRSALHAALTLVEPPRAPLDPHIRVLTGLWFIHRGFSNAAKALSRKEQGKASELDRGHVRRARDRFFRARNTVGHLVDTVTDVQTLSVLREQARSLPEYRQGGRIFDGAELADAIEEREGLGYRFDQIRETDPECNALNRLASHYACEALGLVSHVFPSDDRSPDGGETHAESGTTLSHYDGG